MTIQKQLIFLFIILVNIKALSFSIYNLLDEESYLQKTRKDLLYPKLIFKTESTNYVELNKQNSDDEYSGDDETDEEYSGDDVDEITENYNALDVFDPDANRISEIQQSVGNEFHNYIYNIYPVKGNKKKEDAVEKVKADSKSASESQKSSANKDCISNKLTLEEKKETDKSEEDNHEEYSGYRDDSEDDELQQL